MKKLGLFLLSLLFVSCGGGDEKTEVAEQAHKKVVVAQATKPKTLDPPLANQVDSMKVARQIFNTLLAVNDEGNLVPEIAEKWEFETPTSILFTIRKGIKFHNGAELTVDDVAFSLERMRGKAGTRILVESISGVEVVDDTHVRVTMSEPFSPLLYNLTLSLCGIINKEDTLKRGESEIDELEFKIIPEGNNRLIALETGEVDIAYNINPSDIKFIEENNDLVLVNKPSMRAEYLAFNLNKEPLNQKEFRQAVNMVLDRKGILAAIYDNAGEPATSMLSPEMIGGKPTGDITLRVDKAKELLKKVKNVPSKLSIMTDSVPTNIQTAQIIQSNLKELGIELVIEPVEWGTYLERSAMGEHELLLGGWFPGTNDSDIVLYPLYHSNAKGSAGNRSFYSNPEYDKLVEMGRQETDIEKRAELYREAQAILEEDLPIIPILRKNEVIGMRKNISGFIFRPNGHHVLTKLRKE